jgi:hypothetical protein
VDGKFDDLNVDKVLSRLRRVAAILDGGLPDEDFFPEMGFAREMAARVAKLERQTNDRRILVCLAPNGVGKSAFARWAVAQKRAERRMVRMRPTWRNKKAHILAGIARALGRAISTTNVADIENAVIESLTETKTTLFIDQAHEGGVALMDEIRAFVDETPSRFVWLGYMTAYQRVLTGTTDALIEAQAFLGRCMKPPFDLYQNGLLAQDIQFYLQKVGGLSKSIAESVCARINGTLRAHTNLRLLDDAIASAEAAEGNGKPLADLVVEEVSALVGSQDRPAGNKEIGG